MLFFDTFHFDRSKLLFSACSSGVLCVRPVQAQRPTGDPAADPSDEGSNSACRHPRSGQPHHGVAKAGPQPNHDSLSRGTGRSALQELGHQSDFFFCLRFSGFNRGEELKHFRSLKPNQEVEAVLPPASGATSMFQLAVANNMGGLFKDPFHFLQDGMFIVWVWTLK